MFYTLIKYGFLTNQNARRVVYKPKKILLREKRPTISDKSLGTPSHFCNICRGSLSVRPLPPNSMLFIVMKSSLPAYNIVGGEGGSLF